MSRDNGRLSAPARGDSGRVAGPPGKLAGDACRKVFGLCTETTLCLAKKPTFSISPHPPQPDDVGRVTQKRIPALKSRWCWPRPLEVPRHRPRTLLHPLSTWPAIPCGPAAQLRPRTWRCLRPRFRLPRSPLALPAALAPALADQVVRAALPSLINSVVGALATDPSFTATITAEVWHTTSRVTGSAV